MEGLDFVSDCKFALKKSMPQTSHNLQLNMFFHSILFCVELNNFKPTVREIPLLLRPQHRHISFGGCSTH